jgi:hypothetical protein
VPDYTGVFGTELSAPLSDGLVGDYDPALCQQILNIAKAQAKSIIDPYGMADASASLLRRKTGRSLGFRWHFGNLGILKRHDLPLCLFLYHDQRRAGLDFARFIAFVKIHVRSGEHDRDIGAQKANAP